MDGQDIQSISGTLAYQSVKVNSTCTKHGGCQLQTTLLDKCITKFPGDDGWRLCLIQFVEANSPTLCVAHWICVTCRFLRISAQWGTFLCSSKEKIVRAQRECDTDDATSFLKNIHRSLVEQKVSEKGRSVLFYLSLMWHKQQTSSQIVVFWQPWFNSVSEFINALTLFKCNYPHSVSRKCVSHHSQLCWCPQSIINQQ